MTQFLLETAPMDSRRNTTSARKQQTGKPLLATLVFLAGLIFLLLLPGRAQAAFQIREIPLDAAQAFVTDVSESHVALVAGAEPEEYEVYLYEIQTRKLVRLTDNDYQDDSAVLAEDAVVWVGEQGGDKDIFLQGIGGPGPRKLSDDSFDDYQPRISGRDVVWVRREAEDAEIYHFDRETQVTRALTDNDLEDGDLGGLSVDAGLAAWQNRRELPPNPYGGPPFVRDILWLDLRASRAAVNSLDSEFGLISWPQVKGGKIAFTFLEGSRSYVLVYDPRASSLAQLSDNYETAFFPAGPDLGRVFDGARVVYKGGSGSDVVRLGELSDEGPQEPRTLGTTEKNEFPQIGDGLLVWSGQVGDDYEIFAYQLAAGSLTQLTDDGREDLGARTAGGNVAWTLKRGGGSSLLVAREMQGPAPPIFEDVMGSDPYRTAVEGLFRAGVIDGKKLEAGWVWFQPDDSVLRAQFAKMGAGTFGMQVTEDLTSPFVDLGPDEAGSLYPHEYVGAAFANGLTFGRTPSTFAPWEPISRAGVVSMLVRGTNSLWPGLLKLPPSGVEASTLGNFSTDHALNAWVAEHNGLLAGLVGFGPAWDPWAPASRGEVAQMMWNLLQLRR